MRVYISIDMEGLAGVAHPRQVAFGRDVDRVDYDRARGSRSSARRLRICQ